MDVFKKLSINIPFAEALEQMPSNVKFMKDILSRKRRLEEFEIVTLTEECSARKKYHQYSKILEALLFHALLEINILEKFCVIWGQV